MSRQVGRTVPWIDRIAGAVVIVVCLSVAVTFGLLYALTPSTVVAVAHQYTLNEK